MKVNFSSLKVYVNTEIQKLHNVFSPILHSHGNITSNGMIGDSNDNANKNVVTDENGQITIEEKTEGLDSFNYGYIDENLQCHLIKIEEINILSADSQLLPSEDFNLSGEIITDDETNNPIAVTVYLNNDYLETVYTYGYDKSFDFSIEDSELVSGENIIKMQCGNIVLEHTCLLSQDVLTLTSDKDILSAADNDVATLTAKVYGADVSGKSVVFKNGSTVLDTVTTDSNGEAEYEYTSQGVGDVTITAEYMLSQETYTIQDCLFYDNMMADKTSDYSYINSSKIGRLVYSNNSYYTTVEQNKGHVPLKVIDINGDFHFEVTLKGHNSNNYAFTLHKSSTEYLAYNFYSTYITKYLYPSEQSQGNISPFSNQDSYHTIILDKIDDIVNFEVFDEETLSICSDSYTLPSNFQNIALTPCISPYGYNTYKYNEITFKNVLIKPIPKADKPEELETDELE